MPILLVGASVRAAAASLARLGVRPVAFDLFADLDLAAVAEAHAFAPGEYPGRVLDRLGHLPPLPWMYTGALENRPDVVEAVSGRFRLLGNGPDALRAVRDPDRLSAAVRAAGLHAPEVRTRPDGLPTDGSWLAKPVASGGGEGIRPWDGSAAPDDRPRYYQARVEGVALAAIFVRDGSDVRLAGVTRQILGRPGNRFAYRGSLGPWPIPGPVGAQLVALGRALVDAFDLIGVFGVDLIVAGDRAWTIEVNPRVTASVEVLEHALGRSILADHLRAFGVEPPGGPGFEPGVGVAGKAILFARRAGELAEPISIDPRPDGFPRVADVPRVGTRFEAGEPILTAFGRGDSVTACRRDLARRVRTWRARLEGPGGAIRPGC